MNNYMRLIDEYVDIHGPLTCSDLFVEHDNGCSFYRDCSCDCKVDIFMNGAAIARNGKLVTQ